MPTPSRRRCSFRGIFFGTDAIEDSSGRRLQVDSLPRRNLPSSDDLGKEPRSITLDAFIVGEDYNTRAAQLVDLCTDRDDVGRLVLPYATLLVRCESCVRRETTPEARMARFRLVFVEVQKAPAITSQTSAVQAVDKAAAAADKAGQETLGAELEVKGVPNQVVQSAATEVSKVGSALQALGSVRDAALKSSQLASMAASFVRDAQHLVLEPVQLAQQLSDAIELVTNTTGEAVASLYAYQTLEALRPDIHSSYLVNQNAHQVIAAARLAALAGWAKAAARVAWPSFEDALAARRALEQAIDDQAATASDSVYEALQELRARVGASLPREGQNLPRIRHITLARSMPAILLAYQLHDDTSRAEEIVQRNAVKHPTLLPAAVPLQVLSA